MISGFLREFADCLEAAEQAEKYALGDPRGACFYARRSLELMVHWAFRHDPKLQMPYDDNLSALVNSPAFKKLAGENGFKLAKDIIQFGNSAVHRNTPVRQFQSVESVTKLFYFSYWFALTYAHAKPPLGLKFDAKSLPDLTVQAQTSEQLQALDVALAERDLQVQELQASNAHLDAELVRIRAELAKHVAAPVDIPDAHEDTETSTRTYFIDRDLLRAGWPLADARDREFPVTGMPNTSGAGYVDYVLWGADGLPLGLVEAKRSSRSELAGKNQAKLYADCLEQQFGQRPVIFTSNGYNHLMWDDLRYAPRSVQGFYTPDELSLLVQRRSTRKKLAELELNTAIAERFYQHRAIRSIAESFENDTDRKALVVMATGAGKTRTVVTLSDLLIRANWVKRVLFLADRTALVKQAVNAFKAHLPDSSPVNLLTERDTSGRVFVSTYQTMMNLINETNASGQPRFGVGYFDLIVIDEAHRSVFQKYKTIFDYFDSLLVGLTATPREEIDRNTYGLFDLETGVPTDAYPLADAVADGYLVPATAISVPLQFQRKGIRYDDLSPVEKELWEEAEWDPTVEVPDEVGAEAINNWLFNFDTVDKALEHLMTHGIKVAGGDRLGKTIIFAKNQAHADFISARFDVNYPNLRGHFASVITHKVEYGQDLIDKFSIKGGNPHIAISVDMLDTGIDVPEVVNLVFFKPVRSKTKFWQMLGRGTRLCTDLFAPGEDKTTFMVFDFCQNLEYFDQDVDAEIGASTPSLSTRLFRNRLEILAQLDRSHQAGETKKDGAVLSPVSGANDPGVHLEADAAVLLAAENSSAQGGAGGDVASAEAARLQRNRSAGNREVRASIAELLRTEIGAMNFENYMVRPHRRLIEEFREAAAWSTVSTSSAVALSSEVAGLPADLPAEREEAKRFDLLMLNLELAFLKVQPSFLRMQAQVRAIAELLEEQSSIPLVHQQLELIAEVQTEEWWQDVNLVMLERVRTRLRGLVGLLPKGKRRIVYTDFEDTIGSGVEVLLSAFTTGGFERFKAKARTYVREHRGETAIKKIHMNWPITDADVEELKRVLMAVGTDSDLERVKSEVGGFGLFVRTLIGLDLSAAQEALSNFLDQKRYNAKQIHYVGLVVQELTANGVVDAHRFYDPPYTDIAPSGPEHLFTEGEVIELIGVLNQVRKTTAA
jgi:type I restriction enzyme, R subunit